MSLQNLEDDSGDCAPFLKSKQMKNQNISSTWFQQFSIRKSKSYAIFKNALLKIGWHNHCSVYRIQNPMWLKLLTRLKLGFSQLNEHRFSHCFQSCVNPLCSCSVEIETTTHFLLHCYHFSNICSTLIIKF